MTRLASLKQICRENRKNCTRQLGRITTEAELLDFVTRRQIEVPGFSPNFQTSASPVNQYRQAAEASYFPEKPEKQFPREPVPPAQLNIRELLVNELGRKWKQFGRELGLAESYLDELEERHPRRLQERILDMLKEVSPEPHQVKTALERIGRNDLATQL